MLYSILEKNGKFYPVISKEILFKEEDYKLEPQNSIEDAKKVIYKFFNELFEILE